MDIDAILEWNEPPRPRLCDCDRIVRVTLDKNGMHVESVRPVWAANDGALGGKTFRWWKL